MERKLGRKRERTVLYIDALQPFDNMPSGPCDGCTRDTLCMVFEVSCNQHSVRLCVECLIEYAKRLSTIARGHETIDDLL